MAIDLKAIVTHDSTEQPRRLPGAGHRRPGAGAGRGSVGSLARAAAPIAALHGAAELLAASSRPASTARRSSRP